MLALLLLAAVPALPLRTPAHSSIDDEVLSLVSEPAHRKALASCKRTTPSMFNLVFDRFADGHIANVGIDDAKLAEDPTALCIAREMKTCKLPPRPTTRRALSLRIGFGNRSDAGESFDTDCHFGKSAR